MAAGVTLGGKGKGCVALEPPPLWIGDLPRMYTTAHGGVGRKTLKLLFVFSVL